MSDALYQIKMKKKKKDKQEDDYNFYKQFK